MSWSRYVLYLLLPIAGFPQYPPIQAPSFPRTCISSLALTKPSHESRHMQRFIDCPFPFRSPTSFPFFPTPAHLIFHPINTKNHASTLSLIFVLQLSMPRPFCFSDGVLCLEILASNSRKTRARTWSWGIRPSQGSARVPSKARSQPQASWGSTSRWGLQRVARSRYCHVSGGANCLLRGSGTGGKPFRRLGAGLRRCGFHTTHSTGHRELDGPSCNAIFPMVD